MQALIKYSYTDRTYTSPLKLDTLPVWSPPSRPRFTNSPDNDGTMYFNGLSTTYDRVELVGTKEEMLKLANSLITAVIAQPQLRASLLEVAHRDRQIKELEAKIDHLTKMRALGGA